MVLKELERRASHAGSASSSLLSNSAPADTPVSAATSAEMSALKAKIDQMKMEHDAQVEGMAANHKAMQQALRAQVEAEEAFSARVPSVTVAELPNLTNPAAAALVKYGQLHSLLQSWTEHGASTSFTFGDLIQHSGFATEMPFVLRSMFGSKWDLWFSAEPMATTIIPKQVGELAYQSLERFKQAWTEQNELNTKIEHEAAGSYAALCETGKKRRSEARDVLLV